jgi:hypothetical protein
VKPRRIFKRHPSNLFAHRIVIILPRYAPWLIALALFLGIAKEAVTFSAIVMTVAAIMSVVCVIVSRYQVKMLRDEVSKIIRGIEDDADDLDSDEAAEPAEQPAQRIRLAK